VRVGLGCNVFGRSVWLCLEAASREDGGDAVSVSLDRGTRRQRHWGFGAGIHRCPGSSLARMELKALVREWLNRIPEFEVGPRELNLGCALATTRHRTRDP
jgi:cytochrome P450